MNNYFSKSRIPALFMSLTLAFGASVVTFAQDTQTPQTTAATVQPRSLQSGQKAKISGVVMERNGDTILVRDDNGVDTYVRLTETTSIKSKGGFFRGGKKYAMTNVVRGLILEAEGSGDNAGQLVADKIRFKGDDLRVAKTIDTRVSPVETRVGQVEQNAQRLSGQIDELVAVSNAARGGAKAAQDTADAAVKGVNDTNTRINSIDDYAVQSQSTVLFKVNSAVLLPEAKTSLDTMAQTAQTAKGFVIEVTGFADSTGNTQKNRALSQKRAEAVIQYLVENHNIPLRRILTPYGFGELNSVADNTTREGRAQNRRVEVKLLVSSGLNQNVTVNTSAPTQE